MDIKFMKFLIFSALFGMLLFVLFYYEGPYKVRNDTVRKQIDQMPKVISHKAYFQDYLQNSLEGVEAIMQTDIGGIEIDIQLSKDGVPYVFHDPDLYDLTAVSGTIANKFSNEIDEIYIDYAAGKSENPLPRLEQIFQTVGGEKLLILDIKDERFFNADFAHVLIDLIHEYGLEETVIIASFNPMLIYNVRRIDPDISTMYTFMTEYIPLAEETNAPTPFFERYREWQVFQRFVRNAVKPDFLNVRFAIADSYRSHLLGKLYPIVFWTVDDKNDAIEFTRIGVRAIITNRPENLHLYMEQNHEL